MLRVNEIFRSIQGESTFAGRLCVFIRLAGCNLRCSYCDTGYALEEGEDLPVEDVIKRAAASGCPLIEVTGGEPLLQEDTVRLVRELADRGYTVLVETNGTLDISRLDPRAVLVMDVKCPSSGESDRMRWENLASLKPEDEIKFVIGSPEDYRWAKRIISDRIAPGRKILLSPVFGKVDPADLAGWILRDNLSVRLQLQLQKIIWPGRERGV
ncbi:MAG: radical SAM protein [PVC group bacterium]